MAQNLEILHNRYLQQATWTASIRKLMLSKVELSPSAAILEVGCGTGAVLGNLSTTKDQRKFGIDIDFASLHFAQSKSQNLQTAAADALRLPFPSMSFDFVFCHFLMLWIDKPITALEEMKRVLKKGAAMAIFAEPDYGGRIDHPPELIKLGQMQSEALRAKGADPMIGRKISGLMHQLNLQNISTGILGAQWQNSLVEDMNTEWPTLENDLAGRLSQKELEKYREIAGQAQIAGEKVLYVPTFYSWGTRK